MKSIIKSGEKAIFMGGDFNCIEVKWELFEARVGNTQRGGLLIMINSNIITQWVKNETMYRRIDEPSGLGLIVTKRVDLKGDASYTSAFRESDHATTQVKVMIEREGDPRKEKENRRNYKKSNVLKSKDFQLK